MITVLWGVAAGLWIGGWVYGGTAAKILALALVCGLAGYGVGRWRH